MHNLFLRLAATARIITIERACPDRTQQEVGAISLGARKVERACPDRTQQQQ